MKLWRHALQIPRWGDIQNVYLSSDGRPLVYDFDCCIALEYSPFQKIAIYHSPSFGNTLILDDAVNLAERDLTYTHHIMFKGEENYKDKQVLILGGGDGGILNEVLKESPAFVTLIDIDEMVVKLCKTFLRGACADALDNYDGPHHKIIICDCFPYLEDCARDGKTFDYIFIDLTDLPITNESNHLLDEYWSLMRRALTMSLSMLAQNGKALTHLVGLSSPAHIQKFEELIVSIGAQFKRSDAMIPSFLECWVFYAIWPSVYAAR